MELQQLRYIVALAQELSFVRAANRVHITQPTLSQQIKKLEDELGSPLFERSAQFVKLTQAGEKFIPYAISILDSLQDGIHELQEESKIVSGKIQIGAIPTICPYLLPKVIQKIQKKAPQLILEIYEETTSVLVDHIKTGKVELGILALPISDRSIQSVLLWKEPFFLAVAQNHPLAKKKSIGVKDLFKERLLILQEGHCFGDQSLEFCKRSRQDPQVRFLGSSLTSVMKLTESEEGVTFVPKMAVDSKAWSHLRFIPFAPSQPHRELGVIWRTSATLDRRHQFFIETVKNVLLTC